MKKFLLISGAAALACMTVSARQLSADEALARLHNSGMQRARDLSTLSLLETGYNASGEKAYYVFTNDRQTLFVSADDIAVPLLGYTDEPLTTADNINPTLKWWLGEYAREMAYASANTGEAVSDNSRAKVSYRANRRNIAPLVSTKWNQDAPYNGMTPKINALIPTVTGCVATSTAQALNYWKYPATGTGSITYKWTYSTSTGNKSRDLTMDFGATTFDWDNMLDEYLKDGATKLYTTAQANAVALLMKAAGYSVQMSYSNSASGAQSVRIPGALIDYFGYDKGVRYPARDNYFLPEWEQMMYENLLNIGPIIYNGQGDEGGHSFIVDGYTTDGFFHLNWGWGGASDGYFMLSSLNPGELGIGGGSGGFNSSQDAVLNMRLPVEGSVEEVPFMTSTGTFKATLSGNSIVFSSGGFMNGGYRNASFQIGAQIQNLSTNRIITIEGGQQVFQIGYIYGNLTLALPAGLADGRYKVTLMYRNVSAGQTTYTPFSYNVETGTNNVVLVAKSGTYTLEAPVSQDLTNVVANVTDQNFQAGNIVTFTANIVNNNSSERDVLIQPMLLSESGTAGQLAIDLIGIVDRFNIGANKTVSHEFTFNVPASMTPGRYILGIVAVNTKTLMNSAIAYANVGEAGVDDITADSAQDADAPVRLFNLQGVEVGAENAAPGIYIERRGNQARKIVISE